MSDECGDSLPTLESECEVLLCELAAIDRNWSTRRHVSVFPAPLSPATRIDCETPASRPF
eukprot:3368518-Pleurochrysis_carterae.AAC.1